MNTPSLKIVFALFPGLTVLDFIAPYQFLKILPNSSVTVAQVGSSSNNSDGLTFSDLSELTEVRECDLLFIPGGAGVFTAIHDEIFLGEIARLGAISKYIASVCTGSIVLAAAGLLKNRAATCHWAWLDVLATFPGIAEIRKDRVVRDGNVFTGGGVTSGLDVALTIVDELGGREIAEIAQLILEYSPAPPFKGGRPETSSAETLAMTKKLLSKSFDAGEDSVKQFILSNSNKK